jgi:hypothetical protein
MTTLTHRRYTAAQLHRLISEAPETSAVLTDDHRRSLSARFRAVASHQHRRLDAWMVEQAGGRADRFAWTPATARRALGSAALRRVHARAELSLLDAVRDALDEELLRAASGYARRGSLAHWLAGQSPVVLGLVVAEALTWTTTAWEAGQQIATAWNVAASDAYYDVAGARTTLRGRRDLLISRSNDRVVLRLRSGGPGKSAGPGLRADLIADALADPHGVAAARIIGLWPDAGVCLAVDGSMADLRAGARDLVRTAVVLQRRKLVLAA